jgi:translation elongation factor EF-4
VFLCTRWDTGAYAFMQVSSNKGKGSYKIMGLFTQNRYNDIKFNLPINHLVVDLDDLLKKYPQFWQDFKLAKWNLDNLHDAMKYLPMA